MHIGLIILLSMSMLVACSQVKEAYPSMTPDQGQGGDIGGGDGGGGSARSGQNSGARSCPKGSCLSGYKEVYVQVYNDKAFAGCLNPKDHEIYYPCPNIQKKIERNSFTPASRDL
jgi:hypothetical protein